MKIPTLFWWRLGHACGLVFWSCLALRMPKGSTCRLLILIPFVVHGALLLGRSPYGSKER